MHHVHRGVCPSCLRRFRPGEDRWEDADASVRQELRTRIHEMQAGLCSYCEAPLPSDWHIEHLWPRARFPQRTFDWSNLFGSCHRRDSCGRHKDHKVRDYDPADLIDPAAEDPDGYLFFARDGQVHPRQGLGVSEARKAAETIRVFNLNAPALVACRKRVVDTVLQAEPQIEDLLRDCSDCERGQWVCELLNDYCTDGFMTPVRHLLCA